MVYARYLHSRISAGAKKVGAGHISPRAFRTHIVRFWHLLGCRAIEIGTPFPGGGGDIHGRIRYHGEYIPGTSSRYYNRYEYTYRLFSLVVMPSVFLDCVKASKFQRLAGLSLFFSCAERHLIVYLASLNVRNGASEGEPCIPY